MESDPTAAPVAPVRLTYASAGVDVEAGDRAVDLMKRAVAATHDARVVGGFGGFAGLVDVSALHGMSRPLLATSTDGVGTKVAVAQALDLHGTIGLDLVAMVVDDIVVSGAKPLFMTDYIACGKVVPERVAAIVQGIAEGCARARCALVGGETAEHPGLLGADEYDVAGAVTGVVDEPHLLGPHRVRPGDVVVALASSGLHSNGYSLVRSVVHAAGWDYARHVPEFGRTLGEELLEPTTIYAADLNDLADEFGDALHTASHVTGGGLAANLARVLPQGLLATVERATWALPPVFRVVQHLGGVPDADLERTLNCGVGMLVVVSGDSADRAVRWLGARGVAAWPVGTVSTLTADHDTTDGTYVQGAKGVDGGTVRMVGRFADA